MKVELLGVFALVSCVLGHGYMVVPQARQSMCFEGQSHMPGLWGGEIPDQACRAAFNYVRAKGNPSPQANTPAEIFQFQQRNEFANFNTAPGHDRNNYPNVVPNGEICSAGNNWPDRNSPFPFGDKTGLSIVAPWRKNIITTNNIGGYEAITFQYCATQPHNPSVWHIYYQPGDAAQNVITWDRLRYLGQIGDIAPKTSPTRIPNCFSLGNPHNQYYEFTMGVPMPIEGGTIVVVWQRIDLFGEFFMECIDYKPEGDYVPPPPPPPTEGCPKPTTCPVPEPFRDHPTTDARGVYQCANGQVVATSCGNMWYTRIGCMHPPIRADLRYPCQQWPPSVPFV